MEFTLINNANVKFRQGMEFKELTGLVKRANLHINSGDVQQFATSYQTLVTKLALRISDVAVEDKFVSSYYKSAVEYLCTKVLRDTKFYQTFSTSLANTAIGDVKNFSAEEAQEFIIQCVKFYAKTIIKHFTVGKLVSLSHLSLSPKTSAYKSKATVNDTSGTLSVELLRADASAQKSEDSKKDLLHCELNVSFESNCELARLTAVIDDKTERRIKLGTNNLDLDKAKFNVKELKITVVAKVKIGPVRTKDVECTVTRKF